MDVKEDIVVVKEEEKPAYKYRMTHDVFFKRCMANVIVAREVLETHILPKDILAEMVLSSIKLEKCDFADKTLGKGISDILYSVNWKNKKGYISILCEHQSTPDKLMTFRIQKYMMKIIDLHLLQSKDKEFPLIYPAIIYTGQKPYNVPRSFYDLFPDSVLAKRFFTDPVHVLSLRDIEDIELRGKYHMGAILSLMKEIHRRDIFPHLKMLAPLFRFVARKNLRLLEDMLLYVLDSGKSENDELIIELFAKQVPKEYEGKIMRIRERLIEKGMQQGMQQGMQEGIALVAKNLLKQRLSLKSISQATKLPIAEIEKIKSSKKVNFHNHVL